MTEQTLDGFDQMDALLDGTLDDLADIPEIRVYPEGVHKVKMGWALNHTIPNVFIEKGKESSGLKKFVQFKATAIETVELPAGSTETPLEAGQPFQQLFDLTNEYAQGNFKAIMKALAAHYGAGKTNRQLLADSEGAEVLLVIKHRKDKNKKQDDGSAVVYAQIDALEVV
jgi:hypothetical protein